MKRIHRVCGMSISCWVRSHLEGHCDPLWDCGDCRPSAGTRRTRPTSCTSPVIAVHHQPFCQTWAWLLSIALHRQLFGGGLILHVDTHFSPGPAVPTAVVHLGHWQVRRRWLRAAFLRLAAVAECWRLHQSCGRIVLDWHMIGVLDTVGTWPTR